MQIETTAAGEQAWMLEQLAAPVAHAQWRVWSYPAPAIVLGISQRARLGEVMRRAAPGMPTLVRSSGGGAVLVGPWMIGATALLPVDHPKVAAGLVESYRWFGEMHVDVLREAGVDARTVTPEQARAATKVDGARAPAAAPVKWACFGALSPWEVVDATGRKLAGLAQQRRLAGVAFVAGTLLWQPDWPLLCDALGAHGDLDALRARTTNCVDAIGRGDAGRETLKADVATRLAAALGAALS